MRINMRTLVLSLLFVGAGLSWVWALQGQRASVRAAEALEGAEVKQRLFQETLRRRAADEEALLNAQTTATDVLAEWKLLLSEGLLAVLERVESHAESSGVSVHDVGQATDTGATNSGRLVWNVVGEGGLSEVLQFLAALESDPAFSLVTRLKLIPDVDARLDFELDVTMFRLDVGKAN